MPALNLRTKDGRRVADHIRELSLKGWTPVAVASETGSKLSYVFQVRSLMRREEGWQVQRYAHEIQGDGVMDMSGERCARCGLRLPCNGCLHASGADRRADE